MDVPSSSVDMEIGGELKPPLTEMDASQEFDVEMGDPKPALVDPNINVSDDPQIDVPVPNENPGNSNPQVSVQVQVGDFDKDFTGGSHFRRRRPPPMAMDFGASEHNSPSARIENLRKPTWVDSLKQELHNNTSGSSRSYCIYKIPLVLEKRDDSSMYPVVTLGPILQYHFTTHSAIEKQKWRYLREALFPAGHGGGLERFLEEIKHLEQSARDCYAKTLLDIDSNKFVKMMLLDGCFVIQFLLKGTQRQPISPDDSIFRERWLFRKVKRDLLYLENQIPFFLLQRLFDLIAPSKGIDVSLPTVIQDFFKETMKGISCTDDPKHLLHLFHSNLFPDVYGPNLQASATDLKPVPSAKQLLAAGVELRSSSPDCLYITFEDGVVRIPHLSIEEDTYSLFFNLIAFEKLYPYVPPHVMAYAFFMRCLINSAEDVAALCGKGIIDNWLDSNEEAVDLFKELGRSVIAVYPNEVYLADVILRINQKYCSIRRRGWRRGSFRRSYLNYQSWAIFSVILVLLFLETFFAVLSYFHPPPY
ncbi:hypothetical protein ACLOJK_021131 [Asimina triloba]